MRTYCTNLVHNVFVHLLHFFCKKGGKNILKLLKEAASFHSVFKQVETEETALVT